MIERQDSVLFIVVATGPNYLFNKCTGSQLATVFNTVFIEVETSTKTDTRTSNKENHVALERSVIQNYWGLRSVKRPNLFLSFCTGSKY